jgi:hypothetical protein
MLNDNKQSHLTKIYETLEFIAKKLNSLKIKWLLDTSCSLMVLGIDVVPRDIDILVSSNDIKVIEKELKQFIISYDENNLLLKINEIEIEISKVDDLRLPKSVLFKNIPILVNSLENQLIQYKLRPGKEKTVMLIEKMLKH